MSDRRLTHSISIDALDATLVERPAPGKAPTAFRIWAAGENRSDDGSIYFTKESAIALMAEQVARGRLYPFDFDHLSVMTDRPADAGRASGWHQIECRDDDAGEPELWAVNCDWCQDVRAGLEETPPRWRYFSPTFRVSKSAEVTSYLNCALCINPLTHELPSLASVAAADQPQPEKDTPMDPKKAALAALAELNTDGASDEDKEKIAHLQAYLENFDKKSESGDEDPPPAKKDDAEKEEEGDSDSSQETEKKSAASDSSDEVKHAASMAKELVDMKRQLEKVEISALLDKRTDLPESVKTWAAGQTVAVVRGFLGAAPKKLAELNTKTVAQGAPLSLEADEVTKLMGLVVETKIDPEFPAHGGMILHTVRPSDYRAHVASKGKV
jgi:hypothetical protein